MGGSIENMKPTNVCEVYSVSDNTWQLLPSLPEPKFSQSLCLFSDAWLFQFGGFGSDRAPSPSIERLKLEDGKQWEVLSLKLTRAVSSMGVFQLSLKEMVVFGGWDDGKITEAFFVKEEAPGKFSIHSEDECKLQNEDIFLYNGAIKLDTEHHQIMVCG